MEIALALKIEKLQKEIEAVLIEAAAKFGEYKFSSFSTLKDDAIAYLKGYRDGKN